MEGLYGPRQERWLEKALEVIDEWLLTHRLTEQADIAIWPD